jgi:general secretion pathway protein D
MRLLFVLLLATSLYGNSCTERQFNIVAKKGSKIGDFVEQIVETCRYNLIISGSVTDSMLQKKLNRIYLKNAPLQKVLNTFLHRNNLFYELKDNTLEVSYLKTKTYSIDYISSERTGSSSTVVSLGNGASQSVSGGVKRDGRTKSGFAKNQGGSTATLSNSNVNQIGSEITSTESFNFWDTLQEEVHSILNRPDDKYKVKPPVINKKAGLITVTATQEQLSRLQIYLKRLEHRLQRQVLIDVHILSVKLSNQNSTGINWSQFYSDVSTSLTDLNRDIITTASINQIIRFLQDKGKVSSISNPKILSLNNQPALISVGNELFYKERVEQRFTQNSGTDYTTYTDNIKSIFAGILLDITPEISDDGKITLKISPSISQALDTVDNDSELARVIPPDMTRKQLSTVVTTENGKRIILGGLISSSTTIQKNIVPLFGYIPLIGTLFKSTTKVKIVEELVIVITPQIINRSNFKIKEFGYKYLGSDE